jgi:epoxyqueuosine reductase
VKITTPYIEKRAKELGADLVSVVRSEPLSDDAENLEQWLKNDYHATMAWMARNREKRSDPSKLLPGCKSIICIAVNYYRPDQHLNMEKFPKVSRYAWGRDYHKVLQGILRKLIADLIELSENQARRSDFYIAVDSTPFRDKVWAQRAGLGWIGKHTNLISRELGSWVFLGAVLTTLDLNESEIAGGHPDHCGTCTACIDACPTGAIVGEYKLDSRACISYLTIEHKGEIPNKYRDRLDGWLFGCDVCQDVCPWNKFQTPTGNPDFTPRHEWLVPDLYQLSHLNEKKFDSLTGGSPVRRAGVDKLKRNALAAMGLL